MSKEILKLKSGLRRPLSEAARGLTAAERDQDSQQLCRRLRGQDFWQRATTVLFYAPMPTEPDVWPLVQEALAEGKQVALPRYMASQGEYEARRVTDLDADVHRGQFGIREPDDRCPVVDLNRLDFVLVPGLGFDASGWRLGRGKGYYDRLLAEVRGLKCGIAFDWQMVAEVPTEPHDVRLNCILTPTRCLVLSSPCRF